MKYKLKELDTSKLKYTRSPCTTMNGTVYNVTYNDGILLFQTPIMIINDMILNDKTSFLELKLNSTKACDIFYNKIKEIENTFGSWSGNCISIFNEDVCKLKMNTFTKIYKDNNLF
jgi:hypothetical protein